MLVFFFEQKTAYEMRISDWSSDVCSSDLNRYILNKSQQMRIRRLIIARNGNRERRNPRMNEQTTLLQRTIGLLELYIDWCVISKLKSRICHRQIGRASCRERVCQNCEI